MSCFNCKMYSYESALLCGWDPITAANSPELGCRDIEPLPEPIELVVRVFINGLFFDDILSSHVEEYGLEECVDSYRRLKPGDVLTSYPGKRVSKNRRKAGYMVAEMLPYHYIPSSLSKSGSPCLFVLDYLTQEQTAAGWGPAQEVNHWKLCVCEIGSRRDYPLPDWSDCSGWIS